MILAVKDFASQQGVSPAAIYKHLHTYADRLDGLVIKKPRLTLLTDEAQDFLRTVLVDRTVLVQTDGAKDAQINALEAETKQLLKELADTRQALADAMAQLGEQKALAATATIMEQERNAARDQISSQQEQLRQQDTKIEQLTVQHEDDAREIERLKNRSLWERIRNR